MATDLGGFRLPYSFPLDLAVRYRKCNFFTGFGNYAVGEVLYNGTVVSQCWLAYESTYKRVYSKALNMAYFLSDKSLDTLTKEEFEYVTDYDVYCKLASLFTLCEDDERRLQTRKMDSNLSLEKKQKRRSDSYEGVITGISGAEYWLEHAVYDSEHNKIHVEYRHPLASDPRYRENEPRYRELIPKPYFAKCFWFGVKFNLLSRIVIDKDYYILGEGSIGSGAGGFINYDRKDMLPKLGYAHII